MVKEPPPPLPLVLLSHTVLPLASSRARPPSRRNEILERRPFTGAPVFAVQMVVFSVASAYQTEKEKAFSPASWKPQENVPSGEVRNGLPWSSTDREEPAPSVCCADADGHSKGESSRVIRTATQVDFPSIVHCFAGIIETPESRR
jgi:hypothetical protein